MHVLAANEHGGLGGACALELPDAAGLQPTPLELSVVLHMCPVVAPPIETRFASRLQQTPVDFNVGLVIANGQHHAASDPATPPSTISLIAPFLLPPMGATVWKNS